MTESALYEWLQKHEPCVATAFAHCTTLDEIRTTMNGATGLEVEADADVEDACFRWYSALARK